MTLFIRKKGGNEKNEGKGENKKVRGDSWHLFLIYFIITSSFGLKHLLCIYSTLAPCEDLVGKTSPALNTKCSVLWL